MTLSQLADRIGATLQTADPADADRVVTGCLGLDDAGPEHVSFLANQRYAEQLEKTQAGAVIVAADVQCPERTLLIADDPYFAFRNAVVELHGFRQHPTPTGSQDNPNISPQAVISPTATLGEGCVVHPYAVISDNVTIGNHCVIYPHTFIGPDATIGDDCQLYPNVVVYDHCVIGHRVTLHAGCVIGQDGFGYATHAGAHHKIPQVGNAIIEDDVELGANCAVDRATVGSTIIGQGTKFSDLVAIGHGTKVGKHNLLVALVGIAGSVETGDYVAMGGMVGVAGHLKIGNMVQIAATSGVMTDIPDKAQYGGTPAMPLTEAKRRHLHSIRLPDLFARVKKLERELSKLRKSEDD